MRHLLKKSRKLKKQIKKESLMQEQPQPQQMMSMSPGEAIHKMEQTLRQIEDTIGQQKAGYANAYLNIASEVGKSLMGKGTLEANKAIALAFEYMEAFRQVANVETDRLLQAAPTPPDLQRQKDIMEMNLLDMKTHIEKMRTESENQKVVSMIRPTDAPTESEQPQAI